MVGVFVRLKLRAVGNSLHGRTAALMIVGGLFGLIAALGTIAIGAASFDRNGATVDVLAAMYGLWLAGWIIAPIATGGGDETLRPEHFALLPIGRLRLASGLLAASLVTVPAVVTLLAFCGLIVYGARFGAVPSLIGVAFAAAGLALVVLVYRVVMAALSGLMSARKGKDLALVFVALAALSGVAINYAANSLGPALVEGRAGSLAGVLRALPTGWGPEAIRAAADGRWGVVAGLSAAAAGLIAVLLAAWGALLERRATASAYRGGARGEPDGRQHRLPSPSTPTGAVAVKELRCWWRESRRRLALASSVIIGLVVLIAPAFGGDGESRMSVLPFLGAFVVVMAGLQAGNLYGFDGGALWHTIVTPGAYRADVRGRQLAWAVIVGPVGLVLAAVLPAVTGHPGAYPWVLGLVPALLGGGAGMVVLQSVYVAYPLPDPRRTTNPFAANGRPGFARTLLILGCVVVLALTALPAAGVALAGRLSGLAVLEWAAVPVGIATGAGAALWWGRIATERLSQRAPELLAVVAKEP